MLAQSKPNFEFFWVKSFVNSKIGRIFAAALREKHTSNLQFNCYIKHNAKVALPIAIGMIEYNLCINMMKKSFHYLNRNTMRK